MKLCKKTITIILIATIIILTMIIPIISIADDYVITNEQPNNSSYSGSVSRYEIKLEVNVDKRSR